MFFAVSANPDFASHLLSETRGVAILAPAPSPVRSSGSPSACGRSSDLVLIVAGSVDDQSALAAQITNGTVTDFSQALLNSACGLFVDAAWRRRGEEQASSGTVTAGNAHSAASGRGAGANMLVLGGAAPGCHRPAPAVVCSCTDATANAEVSTPSAADKPAAPAGTTATPHSEDVLAELRKLSERRPGESGGAKRGGLYRQHAAESERFTGGQTVCRLRIDSLCRPP